MLARAFNNMVEQLSDQIKNLEARVGERTSELTGWVGELEQRNQEIVTINSMGDILQACVSHDEIYTVIVKTIKALFPHSSGHLKMCGGTDKELESTINWNESLKKSENQVYEFDDCWSLRRGKTYIMNDSDHSLVCRHTEAIDGNVSPYICVPMIVQGEVLGILHIKPQSSEIDINKRRLAETVAEHAGLSLANLTLQHTLHEQSIKDVLTGLYNRRYAEEFFMRERHRAVRHGIKIGLMLMDVDFFKKVNDNQGHDAGDEVLRQLGALLTHEFRKEDTVCRYGGEEFLAILPYANQEGCRNRAELVRKRVEEKLKIPWSGAVLEITISIGVAFFPDHGDTLQQAVEAADAALYKAKQQGRNCVITAYT